MNEPIDCPDVSLLRHFLDGTEFHDSTWSREQIELHINDCPACQKSIERLVAGQESWEGAARQLAELDANRGESSSELRDLIDHEKNRLPGTAVGEMGVTEGRPLSSTELDFLQPTDQPDSLGRLGSYEILDVVGRGGMGLVLKAYDPSLRRIVAIKVMAAHLASSPVARKRFVREARAAAAVSHDHVVAIFAVEENQEPPFLVMQFVGGKTLQERLVATGSLSVPEILRIGMQTASGLAAAHAQGLVHRDIKPANILLENGVERVKITDFGLARAVDDVGMTQTGVVAGTPQFMAPEQANGESIDVRSDLFSLGSVLYTLCTGRPPFRATTTMGLLKRICEESPRPIRELNPEIPEWLEAIITKLLRKNANDRYQSAKEVAELLSNWLAHVQHPTAVPAPNVGLAVNDPPQLDPVKNLSSDVNPKTVDSTARIVQKSRPLPLWGNYSQKISFDGDIESFFDFAVQALCRDGFVVAERTPSRLKLNGPWWWKKGMNRALSAVRQIDFRIETGTLNAHAKLRIIGIDAAILIPAVGLLSFCAGALIAVGPVVVVGLWYLGRCRQLEERFTKFVTKLLADANNFAHASHPANGKEITSWSVPTETDSSDGIWKFLAGDYSRSVPFSGDSEKSFDLAVASLTSSGFVLNRRTPSQLSLTGPGLNHLRGNLFAAASSIDVTCESRSIRLNAKMGTIRALHAFLLGILLVAAIIILGLCVNPNAGSFRAQRNQIEGGIFALYAIGLFVFGSIIATRRVYQKAFDNFLTNLVMAGGTDRTSGSVNSATISEIAAPRASSSASGQVRSSENSFWQRMREAYPTRAYWCLLAVWGLWMIPIADALETIVVKGMFWVALTYIALGILLPIGLATFAWGQRRTSGSWETTILKRPPIKLLLIPAIIPFLAASTFWCYRQLTCGIVQFDVDDPEFTVNLFNPEKKWSASYSADFYAMRLSSGKYYWDVKHGATFIDRGDLNLTPRSHHTISARSPYPLGQAALMSLPGRWKLQGRQPYGKPSNLSASEADYIDVAGDTIQIHSKSVLDTWSPLLERRPGDKREDVNPQDVTFSFQIPTELPKKHDAKWIDLYVKEGPSHDSRLVARGIFMADEKFFLIRLVPTNMPRPANWNLTPDDKSISLTFQRADDLTLSQGNWKVCSVRRKQAVAKELGANVTIRKDQIKFKNLEEVDGISNSSEDQPYTIRFDAEQKPKRLTLTCHERGGIIRVIPGVYKIEGDKMALSIGIGDQRPLNFDEAAETASVTIELERATP